MECRFRSDFTVTLVPDNCSGTDESAARAAWAVPPQDSDARDVILDLKERYNKDGSPEGLARVLGACLKLRHNSPFEHGSLSVYIEAPGVVWWQLTRQRFMSLDTEDFSFSLESGRYTKLDPEFYVPPTHRPVVEPEDFKPMRPEHAYSEDASVWFESAMRNAAQEAWARYRRLIDEDGIARELARLVLPNWAIYCDGYVTAKPLTWLQFFSKRNRTSETAVATYPQFEIEQVAQECERHFSARWPIVHREFVKNGRQAP